VSLPVADVTSRYAERLWRRERKAIRKAYGEMPRPLVMAFKAGWTAAVAVMLDENRRDREGGPT